MEEEECLEPEFEITEVSFYLSQPAATLSLSLAMISLNGRSGE